MKTISEIVQQIEEKEYKACALLAESRVKWPMQQRDLLSLLSEVVDERLKEFAPRTIALVNALVDNEVLERYSEIWIHPKVNMEQLCAEFCIEHSGSTASKPMPRKNLAYAKGRKQSGRTLLPGGYEIVMVALLHVKDGSIGQVPQAVVNYLRLLSLQDIPNERAIENIFALLREKKWADADNLLTKKGRAIALVWEERIKQSPEDW